MVSIAVLSFWASPLSSSFSLYATFTPTVLILFFKNSNPFAAKKNYFKKTGYLFFIIVLTSEIFQKTKLKNVTNEKAFHRISSS